MTNRQIENLRIGLQEIIDLYPDQRGNDPDIFEYYVKNTYDYTEYGFEGITYPEFLYQALKLISRIDADFNFALENEIRRFQNGQYEGWQDDRIEYEASDNQIYDIIYDGIKETWVVEGYADGLHWERDDFKTLFGAIDDLEIYLQEG